METKSFVCCPGVSFDIIVLIPLLSGVVVAYGSCLKYYCALFGYRDAPVYIIAAAG